MTTGAPLSAVLQRIRNVQLQPKPRPGERCELCATLVPDEHSHVVDLQTRALMCACRPCYLVFAPDGAGGVRYRAVPDRFLAFDNFSLSPAEWEGLQIPVGVAFFFVNSEIGRVVAFYPGPAGATESMLSLDSWDAVVAANPQLATLRPDVEAFLVRSADPRSTRRPAPGAGEPGLDVHLPVDDDAAQAECFLVPIDVCYELVGELRRLWRGFDGGTEAHQAMEEFFDRVRSRSGAKRLVG